MPKWKICVRKTFVEFDDEDLAIVLKMNSFLVAFQFPCERLHFYITSDTYASLKFVALRRNFASCLAGKSPGALP